MGLIRERVACTDGRNERITDYEDFRREIEERFEVSWSER